jgi:hypothetical protein
LINIYILTVPKQLRIICKYLALIFSKIMIHPLANVFDVRDAEET